MLQWITASRWGWYQMQVKKRAFISYPIHISCELLCNTIQASRILILVSVSLCHRHWSVAVLLLKLCYIPWYRYSNLITEKKKCSKHWLYFKLLVLCDIIEREIPIRPSQNLLQRGNQTETSWHKWGGANSSFQTEDELSSPSVKCIRIILNNEWCKATVAV